MGSASRTSGSSSGLTLCEACGTGGGGDDGGGLVDHECGIGSDGTLDDAAGEEERERQHVLSRLGHHGGTLLLKGGERGGPGLVELRMLGSGGGLGLGCAGGAAGFQALGVPIVVALLAADFGGTGHELLALREAGINLGLCLGTGVGDDGVALGAEVTEVERDGVLGHAECVGLTDDGHGRGQSDTARKRKAKIGTGDGGLVGCATRVVPRRRRGLR